MANDDDDLKLNSLNRFAKKSPRLAYEEYSHCEVPAGCGGVVMRWTDPDEGIPAMVRGSVAGRWTCFLDGAQLDSGRAVLPYGDHVLALALERDAPNTTGVEPPAGGILSAIAGALRPPRVGSGDLFAACVAYDVDRINEYRVLPGAASAADGTWRALGADDPPDGWRDPAFDDSAWAALAAAPAGAVDALPQGDHHRWRFQELARFGAQALLLPEGTRVWIRKRFTVVRA